MNSMMTKRNMVALGLGERYNIDTFAKEKAASIEPSVAQKKYRDELYKFVAEKGIVRDSFKLGRTKQMIGRDIRSLHTIITKHGLWDEWERRADNG